METMLLKNKLESNRGRYLDSFSVFRKNIYGCMNPYSRACTHVWAHVHTQTHTYFIYKKSLTLLLYSHLTVKTCNTLPWTPFPLIFFNWILLDSVWALLLTQHMYSVFSSCCPSSGIRLPPAPGPMPSSEQLLLLSSLL